MEDSISPVHYKRVLVVDDTQIDRYVAERNIKRHHFAEEVILKESARSALEYLNSLADTPEELPTFIFLDIRMPEIDGFGFLMEYEKLPEVIRLHCIIVMLSSSLDQNDHERARNNRYVNNFFNKPLNKEQLDKITPPTGTH
ncbi:hypothetical protein BH11BAC2_BH11BAC2_11430 [soil metagenome]